VIARSTRTRVSLARQTRTRGVDKHRLQRGAGAGVVEAGAWLAERGNCRSRNRRTRVEKLGGVRLPLACSNAMDRSAYFQITF